jgi:hypothetical protein
LNACSARELTNWFRLHGHRFDAILLHVSPYGYQKRAVPWWLASGIQRIQKTPDHPPIVTFFHELFASGPPTSSAFWLQPLQKHILRKIARSSSSRLTNRQPYADWLDFNSPSKRATPALPVFSNFGEMTTRTSLHDRPPEIAMFSAGNHSGKPLSEMVAQAAKLSHRLGLARIHLIGKCSEAIPDDTPIPVDRHGLLSPDAISRILRTCQLGYTAYTPTHFGKSTLLAAMASHGLAVVCRGDQTQWPDGLNNQVHLINEPDLFTSGPPTPTTLDTLSASLYNWYQPHSLNSSAAVFAKELSQISPSS